MAQQGDYQLAAPGATFAAKLAAAGAEAYVQVPKDAGLISALATAEFAKGAATARHELWPWHVLAAVASSMYEDGGLTGYATDVIPLPQTLGATLTDAETTGFFATAAEHKRVSTLAAALGLHAAAQRAAGNAAPYVLDDTKVYDFHTATIPQGAPTEVLNDLMASDVSGVGAAEDATAGQPAALLMLPTLGYPYAPMPDFDGTDAGVVIAHAVQTAQSTFPTLASTSLRLALAKLLKVSVPPELIVFPGTLGARIAYVDLLAQWSDVAQRPHVIQAYFPRTLVPLESLGRWVLAATGPFQKALQLLKGLGLDSGVLEIESLRVLNATLERASELWNAGRTADQNVEYLLDATRKRGAPSGSGVSTYEGDTPARLLASGGSAGRMAALAGKLGDWAAGDAPDPFEAIELIYDSGLTKAIQALHGHAGMAQLPAVFLASCAKLGGKMDEYVIDTLKHDADGVIDRDLEDLTVRHLHVAAPTLDGRRAFFKQLYANKFAMDWDKLLVAPILALLQPGEPPLEHTAREVFASETRQKAHRLYVSRALAAVGKRPEVDNSYDAICDEWEKALLQATRGGAAMREDCLDAIDALMSGVWANAEATGVAELRAEAGDPALFDPVGFSELSTFRQFVEDMPGMKKLASRYKRTFGAMTNASTATSATVVTTAAAPAAAAGTAAAGPPPPPKAYVAPPPGSKMATIGQDDAGWVAQTKSSHDWYHVGRVQQLVQSKFGVSNICVLSCLVPHTAGHELEDARAYCEHGHALNAPEHKLALQRRAVHEALRSAGDCIEQRPGGRAANGAQPRRRGSGSQPRGRGSGGGGSRGRGRFRGQTAPGQ